MAEVLAVFGITFPIFAVVAIGYGLVATRIVHPDSVPVFGFYVMNIALPAVVLSAIVSSGPGTGMNGGFVAAYSLGSLATILLSFLWFSLSTGPVRRSVAVLGSSYPNSSFVGYPLMLIAFPDIAGAVLAMSIMVESLLIAPIAFIILADAPGQAALKGASLARVKATAINLLRRPIVLALIGGFALSAAGLTLPAPVMRLTALLADSAPAMALLVIGGSIAGLPVRGNRALAAQIVAGKLVLHPAMTFLAVMALGAFGISLGGDMQSAVVIAAALPMLSIYASIAQEVDQAGLAALAQLGAIVGAFFSLSILLAVLG